METKINILKPFFENPQKEFYIRELSRLLKINHTTVRHYLNMLMKEEYLQIKKSKPYSLFKINLSRKYLNLKLHYNLEKLRESRLIEDLEKAFEYPVTILFGSFAYGLDDKTSDVDICIISNTNKEFNVLKYEKIINRKINLQVFTKKKFEEIKEKNPNFINNICNGIVLSGQLEILK